MPSYRKALPWWVLKLSSAASTWEMSSGSCFRCSEAEMALWILRVESLPWTEHSNHPQDTISWHMTGIVSCPGVDDVAASMLVQAAEALEQEGRHPSVC